MNECACIDIDLDDHPEFSSSKYRMARKEHKCSECERAIAPGETYEYVSMRFEGVFSQFKTCGDCLSVRDWFFCRAYYHARLWEDVEEHVRNCNDRIGEKILTQLTPRARDRVCDLIQEEWEVSDETDS